MTRTEVFSQITNVFFEVFDEEDHQLTEQMSAEDVDAWDSLTHIQIITEVEKRFKVRFDTREIEALHCIGDMVDLVISKQ